MLLSNDPALKCTDLSCKEPHILVAVGRVVISGSLLGVMGSTLAQNTRYLDMIPVLGALFPIFITLTTLVVMIMFLYKVHDVMLLNLPLSMYMQGNRLYVCN